MLLSEKKLRSIVRKILLQEKAIDPTDVSKSFDLDKAIDLARKLVVKDSVRKNEKDKKESIKISKALAAIRDGVPGEPNQSYQTALAHLLNFEGPGKNESEYKDLLEMVRSYLRSIGDDKKGDVQAAKGKGRGEKNVSDKNVLNIQRKLNSLNFKDYKDKKLDEDGKWGSRTRSATSKMLKMIDEGGKSPEKGLFEKLNLNLLANDPLFSKLETGSKGPGSWKDLAIKLVEGKPFYKGGGKYPAVLAILNQFEENNLDTLSFSQQEDDDKKGYKQQKNQQKIENSRLELVNQILASVRNAPTLNNWLDRTNDYIYIDKESLISSRYLYLGMQPNIDTIKPIVKLDRESALKQRIVYLDRSTNKTKPIDEKIQNDIIDKTQKGFKMVFFRMEFGDSQRKTKYFAILTK